MTKDQNYTAGLELMNRFCNANGIQLPDVVRLNSMDRLYYLATCAFYRPYCIHIMVEKCAPEGMAGRAWSWPAYVIDRTPYGVMQHELGHHVDTVKSGIIENRKETDYIFSRDVYEESQEEPLTGYLGTDKEQITFYMEWFAENFRLFVTNPDLLKQLRPKFYAAVIRRGLKTVIEGDYESILKMRNCTERILDQARKKVQKFRHLQSHLFEDIK